MNTQQQISFTSIFNMNSKRKQPEL